MNTSNHSFKSRLTFSFVLSIILFLLFSCALPVKTMDSGWVSFTGRGVPAPYDLKSIVSNNKELSFNLKIDGFEQEIIVEDSKRYQSIKIPKAGYTSEVGKPNLPVIRRMLAVPEGKSVKATLVDSSYVTRYGYNIYPVQEPVVEQAVRQQGGGGPYRTPFTINKKFYKQDRLYPDKVLSVSEPMRMGGQTVVQVEVFPVQYNPDKKMLKMLTSGEVKINFVDKDGTMRKPDMGTPVTVTASQWKQYKKLINIDWLRDFLVLRTRANYLIITEDEFVEEVAPLAAWKRMKGLTTKIVKISDVGSTDTAIRNYISNAYHHWKEPPSYVLLVGDVDTIPAHIYDNGSTTAATDLFYATVDGTDFLPDLAVGRFSAKTESEVIGMVNKTIAYEKTPEVSPDEWYSRVSLISDSGYFENTSDWIHSFLTERGYAVDRFYRSTNTTTPANISNTANEGRVILNYRGHGLVTKWVTGNFNNADVLALNNNSMLPVIITPTCQTGWFDHATLDSFGETWLKAGGETGDKGAVAFWGSSRNSYGGYNDELAKGTYKAAFQDGLNAFGDITNEAKMYMFDVYGASSMAQLEFNLFNVLGDPELNVWFQVPTVLPAGWAVIDLDILGSNRTGGVSKDIMQDVGGQKAFPVLTYPYATSAASFTTFSVPEDWDGRSDFLVQFIWFSPTQDGNVKWSIVYDRKDAAKTPYKGFNRHISYAWGARKERVSHSNIEIYSLSRNGPMNRGDIITLGLERFKFNPDEAGSENAITSGIHLMAARMIYRTSGE
jgi:hypothetical protein